MVQNKEIKFQDEAKAAIKEGIDLLAKAVKSTLGPKGQCVVISDYSQGQPHVTKDGVTVAKNIGFRDRYLNAGACLIREAALKTVAAVGDSTTTSIVLSHAFIEEADKLVKKGYNPVQLKNDINTFANRVYDYIRSNVIALQDSDIKKVATISANNDREIGKLISNVFASISKDGVVIVEESPNIHTSTDIITGMQFDKGFVSPHFITDSIKEECILEDPYILITEHKFMKTKDLISILNMCVQEKRPILIIAEDFDEAVIENFKLNKLQGLLKCCLVKTPSFGEYRKEFLKDIATVIGGNVIDYDSGLDLSDTTLADLGGCKKVIITKKSTTIVKGYGTSEDINIRVSELRNQLENVRQEPGMDGSFMIDFLQKRIAKLIGGICTIYVGGTTELEMKERKDRVDDAVAATRSAIEGGIVAGGGVTFGKAAEFCMLQSSVVSQLFAECLLSVFRTLAINAGKDPDELYKKVHFMSNLGWDANSDQIVNMIDAGIIDPAYANLISLENAISVVNLYLSTNCVIVPEQQIITI